MAQVAPQKLKKDSKGKYVKGAAMNPTKEEPKKQSKKPKTTASVVITDDRRKV